MKLNLNEMRKFAGLPLKEGLDDPSMDGQLDAAGAEDTGGDEQSVFAAAFDALNEVISVCGGSESPDSGMGSEPAAGGESSGKYSELLACAKQCVELLSAQIDGDSGDDDLGGDVGDDAPDAPPAPDNGAKSFKLSLRR